jgi:hypothetical protein
LDELDDQRRDAWAARDALLAKRLQAQLGAAYVEKCRLRSRLADLLSDASPVDGINPDCAAAFRNNWTRAGGKRTYQERPWRGLRGEQPEVTPRRPARCASGGCSEPAAAPSAFCRAHRHIDEPGRSPRAQSKGKRAAESRLSALGGALLVDLVERILKFQRRRKSRQTRRRVTFARERRAA